MIKPMDKANMLLEMELCIKALGLKTKEAGMGANNGQMVLFLMDYNDAYCCSAKEPQ